MEWYILSEELEKTRIKIFKINIKIRLLSEERDDLLAIYWGLKEKEKQ